MQEKDYVSRNFRFHTAKILERKTKKQTSKQTQSQTEQE